MHRPHLSLRAWLALGLSLAAGSARANDYVWTNTAGGNWAIPGNWSGGVVPGAADNALFTTAGTYTVTLNDSRSITNVALNVPTATVSAFGGNLNLGGTMTLTAGNWLMGGIQGTPAVLTGGSITRGTSGAGTFTVGGDLRLVNTQVQGAALVFDRSSNPRLRLSGTAAFTPGSVVNFAPANQTYGSYSGITLEAGGTLDNVTVNLGANTTLGTLGGQSLTVGPNAVVSFTDPGYFAGSAVIGREVSDDISGIITLTNRGTIRALGDMYVGRYFDLAGSPSNVVFTNSGLVESRFSLTLHVNSFTNAPGGVLRATAGGDAWVYAPGGWVNQGTFDVGDGGSLRLGGRFTRAGIGAVSRTGTNTIALYASRMDNSGGTWALDAGTGSYQILSESGAYSEIIGGGIAATGGAKLQVRRTYASSFSPVDTAILTGVQVGAGVLDFAETGGKLLVRGNTTFTPGDTITLAGTETALQFLQTSQVDGVTLVLSGDRSALTVWDDNTLTFGPTTTVRKTGAGQARLNGETINAPFGTPTAIVNRGLIHVQQGALQITGLAGFSFTNRGTVQVDAGATVTGLLTDGGTVRGGGTVNGGLTFTGTGNELRPGADTAPGTLTVTGNLALNPGTTLFARLNGTAPGTGYDQLAVNGTVDLGGSALSVLLGGSYAPAAGDKLFVLTNDGTDPIAGIFAGLPNGATVPVGSYSATISYSGDAATQAVTGGNDVVLSFAPVPEPASVLTAAATAAAAGAAAWWRRRRAD
jgi:hypothetical protein